ncbi:MAG: hypothetical protein LH479_08600 [Polaromonas sp.]|nr:hypothetical protein [Polaromonas sp.]
MAFDLFGTRPDAHIRKAQEYLQQAHVARIEHQTAAEHHAALAAMYANRVAWLEREVSESITGGMASLRSNAAKPVETIKRNTDPIFTLARTPRIGGEGVA